MFWPHDQFRENRMEQRTISDTDVITSAIGFGTASLHHLFWHRDRLQLLETAFSNGITHFDTSPYYGLGLAEKDLGKFIANRRDSVTVTTKVGIYSPDGYPSSISIRGRKLLGRLIPSYANAVVDWTVETAQKSFELSLKRLKTDFVDFLLLHEPISALIHQEQFVEWLQKLKRAGRIRYFGIAGLSLSISPWVATGNCLAEVVQTKDSIENHEADFVLKSGRKLQFTYGYLSNSQPAQLKRDAIPLALNRNATGTIIVSTRKVKRIREMVEQ